MRDENTAEGKESHEERKNESLPFITSGR
jgi:hypothetical protein